eukprot:scaffold1410_cov242-Pinguiococcus_pyrenoidosus.AAC.6
MACVVALMVRNLPRGRKGRRQKNTKKISQSAVVPDSASHSSSKALARPRVIVSFVAVPLAKQKTD